jgi:sugar lactone lactonase YvrE
MPRRWPLFFRAGCILLALVLFAQLRPTAVAFTNGQAASLVLGQPDFTSAVGATTASGIRHPSSVVVDRTNGKVYIAETGNNRVLRFASGAALVNGAAAEGVLGQPDFTSSSPDTTASRMRYPLSVAIDNTGRLWVADSSNNRVLRFDSAASKPNGAPADAVLGQLDFTSAIQATTASHMFFPGGVAVDSSGYLWVADELSSRVLRFDDAANKLNGAPAEAVLGQPDFSNSAAATTASAMYQPTAVAMDSAGRLWVADSNNNRVLRFDSAAGKPNGAAADGVLGQPDFTSSAAATTASAMNTPGGVAVDSANRLWVAEGTNNRALRFDDPIIPTITWANPAAITYGTPLSADQLNATASVPGSFSYSPPPGTVLRAGIGQPLSVIFTPTDSDNYTIASKTVTIDVVLRLYLPPIAR